ncbi:MAG: response regulator [bacterium]
MMDKKKILIVDDEEDIIDTLKFRFEQEEFEVITAASGYEALGAVRVNEPDLVVLDVMIPQENGYRVSRLIKEDVKNGKFSKEIKVLLLTARRLDNNKERETSFLEFSQADLMMYKPFEMQELLNNIYALLA